ncbi:hypothetical protein [Kribbia dieselivorans]|uniref:hypothetical protein n=1 Tax=Kribbia dieselivorans TaxID=331526 RepID=UPI000839712F|nr:hypothetical protein [Kribbia dieselivorans]
MTSDYLGQARETNRTRYWQLSAGLGIIALWAVILLLGVRSGYQMVTLDDLQRDADAGTVSDIALASGSQEGPTTTMQTGIRLILTEGTASTAGGIVAYTLKDDARGWFDDRVRVVMPPGEGATSTSIMPLLQFGRHSELSKWGSAEKRVAGLVSHGPHSGALAAVDANRPSGISVAEALTAALLLGTLALIITGPRPGWGTRWYWFWMLAIPAGLGTVAYAVVELLRGRAGASAPAGGAVKRDDLPIWTHDDPAGVTEQVTPPKDTRRNWWRGLLWGVVVWPLLLSLAGFLLVSLLRPTILPA